MKFSTQFVFLLSIGGANAQSRRRRHLNNIKGGESSMSYASTLYAAKGSTTSRSKSSPTSAPTPMPGECGSTITEDFVLEKDLLDCDCLPLDGNEFGYALRVAGRGVTLNLNGYTVKCPSGFGKTCGAFNSECDSVIQVDGTGNIVQGPGFVKSGTNFTNTFGNGIKIVGEGSHVVDNVSVGPIENSGIEVRSSNNVVSNSYVSESSPSGIRVRTSGRADRTIIRGNTIVDISGRGIEVDETSDTQVLDNRVFSSSKGIANLFAERTIIRGNIINGNDSQGIEDFTGDDTIIDSNTVTNNGVDGGKFVGGIFLGSLGETTVTVTNNIAVGNGVDGTKNFVIGPVGNVEVTLAGNTFETQPAPSP